MSLPSTDAAPRSPAHRLPLRAGAVLTIVLLAIAAFTAGRLLAPTAAPSNPTQMIGAIPVGVAHSPAGALTAADNYVLVEQESVEQNPARETQLITTVDALSYRASDLQSATMIRSQDQSGMAFWKRGGRVLTFIGARRVDYYRGDVAEVTIWSCQISWLAGEPRRPSQSWGLGHVSLAWHGTRWMVTRDVALPTAGPVPAATPQAGNGNDVAGIFTRQLAGFGPVVYGAVTK